MSAAIGARRRATTSTPARATTSPTVRAATSAAHLTALAQLVGRCRRFAFDGVDLSAANDLGPTALEEER